MTQKDVIKVYIYQHLPFVLYPAKDIVMLEISAVQPPSPRLVSEVGHAFDSCRNYRF